MIKYLNIFLSKTIKNFSIRSYFKNYKFLPNICNTIKIIFKNSTLKDTSIFYYFKIILKKYLINK